MDVEEIKQEKITSRKNSQAKRKMNSATRNLRANFD
jgi:hypothetical protein